MRRYLLNLIGDEDISEILSEITDERGANYVEGRGMFICTFYSDLSTDEMLELFVLSASSGIMIFDITEQENFVINLPSKYYLALFPETKQILEGLNNIQKEVIKKEEKSNLLTVDDILDKLSKNNYDRKCLTKKELEILKNNS